jgi:hypothetical protein
VHNFRKLRETTILLAICQPTQATPKRRISVVHYRSLLILMPAAALIAATASSPGQAPASKAYLLNVGKGQTFNDIGSDDKTKLELIEDFKELGGKALKVAFFKGDSVGDRVAKVKMPSPWSSTWSTRGPRTSRRASPIRSRSAPAGARSRSASTS